MIEAADEAVSFVAGQTRTGLETDRKTLFAAIRCIEIINEAAGKASDATRNNASDVPWIAIFGMRNRLVHADFDVDLAWKTTSIEPPALKARLRALI